MMTKGTIERMLRCVLPNVSRVTYFTGSHKFISLTMTPPRKNPQSRLRLEDQLCFALYAATNAVTRAYRPLLDAVGITYPQYLVLMVLWQDSSHTMGEIAERLGLPTHGVTPIVGRLEAAGFVRRVRKAPDLRVVWVSLTRVGRSLEITAAAAQREVVCATHLEAGALATLRNQLQILVRRVDEDQAGDLGRIESRCQ